MTPFERALQPHLDTLRRLALRLTGSAEDAEDLMQEFLTRLYPRAGKVMAVEQLRPWLMRVLYRQFVDRWRRRRADPVIEDDTEPDDRAGDAIDMPDAVFDRQLTAERLQAALDRLPAPQRELVILHDVEGYTLPEVAQILEVSLGTLKSRLHRARRRVRDMLVSADELLDGTLEAADS